eukprot:CFRG7816T1
MSEEVSPNTPADVYNSAQHESAQSSSASGNDMNHVQPGTGYLAPYAAMAGSAPSAGGPMPEGRKDKRAHHTALERKRRDHIKDKFAVLHKEVPGLLENDKVSRSNILTKATDYIVDLSKRNEEYHEEVERLKRQNLVLQQQIDQLEAGKVSGQSEASSDNVNSASEPVKREDH